MDKLPPWLPQLCDPPHSPGSAGSTKLRNRRVSHHVSQRRHRREPGPHTTPRPPDPGGLSGIIHRLYQNELPSLKMKKIMIDKVVFFSFLACLPKWTSKGTIFFLQNNGA